MKTKTAFTLIFVAISWILNGQTLEKGPDGNYMSTGVVQIDSSSKEKLFGRAMEWISINYKSANDVIQHSSQSDGKIICKGNFSTSLYMKQAWISHTLILEFRENRYKYTYSNFVYTSSGSGNVPLDGPMMGKKKALNATEESIIRSVNSLTDYLKGGNSESDKW